MATTTLSVSNGNRGKIYTLTYSVSSSNTATTVTLTSLKVGNSSWAGSPIIIRFYADSTSTQITSITDDGWAVDSTHTINSTYSWNKAESAQTKHLLVYGKESVNGSETTIGTTDIEVSVPALAKYAVTYNANGGSGAPATQYKVYGKNLTLSTVKPTRSGFSFVKWFTAANGTGTGYNPGATYSTDAALNLYAKWSAIPSVTSLTVIRSDSSGNQDDSGTYASVTATWTMSSATSESATVTGTITPQGGTSSAITLSGTTTGTGGTVTALVPNMDTDMQYVVAITAANGSNTATRSAVLTRAFFIMDFKAGGGGIGIGRAAPANGLEVGYETAFDDDVTVFGDVDVDGVIHSDGNVYIDNKAKGYYVIDQANVTYPAVYDNGTNLWVGAESGAGPHHTGALCLSTGYTGTGGNKTFSACVPNADNTGGTFYDVFHTGYLDVSKATDGNLPISHGGTNASDRLNGFRNIAFLGWNPTGGSANDTRAKWASLGTGLAIFNATGQLNNQPGQYGFLINLIESSEIHQIWLTQANGKMLQRGGNNSTTAMGTWYSPHTTDCLYNNATGTDGTVSLSASAANYNHMRIYFKKNGDSAACGSTDVFSPNGKKASFVLANYSGSTHQIMEKVVTISGTSITKTTEGYILYQNSNTGWNSGTTDTTLYIYRVEAWNEWN